MARELIPLPPPVISPALSEFGPPRALLKIVGRARLPPVEAPLALVSKVGRAQLPLMKTLLAHVANPGRSQLPLPETSLAGQPVLLALPVQARDVQLLPLTTPPTLSQSIPPVPAGAHYLAVVSSTPVVIVPPAPLRRRLYLQPQQKRDAD